MIPGQGGLYTDRAEMGENHATTPVGVVSEDTTQPMITENAAISATVVAVTSEKDTIHSEHTRDTSMGFK